MEENKNIHIATQVILKGAVELVTSGKFETLDNATDILVSQYEKVFNKLSGEPEVKVKESATNTASPKIELEVTPIPKNESTKTYDEVKADAKAHKSYTAAFTKIQTLTTKEGIDDITTKVKSSVSLTEDMKTSLIELIKTKEAEILTEILK